MHLTILPLWMGGCQCDVVTQWVCQSRFHSESTNYSIVFQYHLDLPSHPDAGSLFLRFSFCLRAVDGWVSVWRDSDWMSLSVWISWLNKYKQIFVLPVVCDLHSRHKEWEHLTSSATTWRGEIPWGCPGQQTNNSRSANAVFFYDW